MTARDEITDLFQQAFRNIDAQAGPPGVGRPVNAPDINWVTINETNGAIVKALHLLADRIDRMESGSTSMH